MSLMIIITYMVLMQVSLPVLDANNRKIREILAFSEQDDKPDEGTSNFRPVRVGIKDSVKVQAHI